MGHYLDTVPLSGIIRIRDMMYSVKDPFRLAGTKHFYISNLPVGRAAVTLQRILIACRPRRASTQRPRRPQSLF